MTNYVEAINKGHKDGLNSNLNSYIIGLGVNYENGADGTTKGLFALHPEKILDVPVSESAITGMCVGMATMGLNAIVHHGRVEFALYAMDQILTQAAKWNYMFGGDYPCYFSARLNIGRQWGNGPQHTSSYNSLFANTPGLNVFWPSRPKEAYVFTKALHHIKSPTLHMEHRWLFKTVDNLKEDCQSVGIQTAAIYGQSNDVVILTYGDGLIEALKTKESVKDIEISVICLTAFINNRVIDDEIIKIICNARNILVLDTSNYEYGILQGVLGSIIEIQKVNGRIKVFSPPFLPVATSAKLVKEYYPTSPEIIKYLLKQGLTKTIPHDYSFDEINLPPQFDFSKHIPTQTIKEEL